MATHSSTLAWKIKWTGRPGGIQSLGLQRVGHDWTCTPSLMKWLCLRFLFPIDYFCRFSIFPLYQSYSAWLRLMSLDEGRVVLCYSKCKHGSGNSCGCIFALAGVLGTNKVNRTCVCMCICKYFLKYKNKKNEISNKFQGIGSWDCGSWQIQNLQGKPVG